MAGISSTLLAMSIVVFPSMAFAYGDCGSDAYRSSDGSCVHSPYHTSEHVGGETAVCNDGTHSVSHHHQGTCSHHGGVASWD